MLTAIPRHGPRAHPATAKVVAACRERGEFIQGPHIAAFERAFAARLGTRHAIAASHGRMAYYFVLRAMELPPGAEVIVPALTFWGIPELTRAAGLEVRFADVDPGTGCLAPAALRAAICAKTRAVVPTHLSGLPCDMDAILDIAGNHRLAVIEDCAQALGATYRGRPVGTFGDAAVFSFGTLKPLNCAGGGMAVVRDDTLAARVRQQIEALPWPHEKRIANKLLAARLLGGFLKPGVFTFTGFPILWASSYVGTRPDLYAREKARLLSPLPEDHLERFSNVQAAIGLAGLDLLDGWTAATRFHARSLTAALADLAGIEVPADPPDGTHVYYQYCLPGPGADALGRDCARRGVHAGTRQADVCPRLDLFSAERCPAPGAEKAADVLQVPVHASMTDPQLRRVIKAVRAALTHRRPWLRPAEAPSRQPSDTSD